MNHQSTMLIHARFREAIQQARSMIEMGDDAGAKHLLLTASRRHATGVQAWADQVSAAMRDYSVLLDQ